MILFVGLLIGFFVGVAVGGFFGWEMKKSANITVYKNVTIQSDREILLEVIDSIEAVDDLKKKLNLKTL